MRTRDVPESLGGVLVGFCRRRRRSSRRGSMFEGRGDGFLRCGDFRRFCGRPHGSRRCSARAGFREFRWLRRQWPRGFWSRDNRRDDGCLGSRGPFRCRNFHRLEGGDLGRGGLGWSDGGGVRDPEGRLPGGDDGGVDDVVDDLLVVGLDVAAGAEVEPVYAGAQVGAVRLQAVDGEHADATLIRLPRDARKVADVPSGRSWNQTLG